MLVESLENFAMSLVLLDIETTNLLRIVQFRRCTRLYLVAFLRMLRNLVVLGETQFFSALPQSLNFIKPKCFMGYAGLDVIDIVMTIQNSLSATARRLSGKL